MVTLRSMLEIPANHRSLFGESEVIALEPQIIEEGATVIPRHFKIRESKN